METRQCLGKWLDRKVRILMDQTGSDYETAYRKVLKDDAEAVKQHANLGTYTTRGPSLPPAKRPRREAGIRLHELILAYMEKHDVQNYYLAMQMVLMEHPNLAREYSES